MVHEKLLDYLMFREYNPNADRQSNPSITTGSIVYGLLLRSAIIIIFSMTITPMLELYSYWWAFLLLFWLGAAYPAYRQFQFYSEKIDSLTEDTLCGKCKHFDASSQLCKIMDEHIGENYIPCGGEGFEPKKIKKIEENEDSDADYSRN